MYIPVSFSCALYSLKIDRETALHLPAVEGAPKTRPVVSIASNREKTFVAVATGESIYIWLAHVIFYVAYLNICFSHNCCYAFLQYPKRIFVKRETYERFTGDMTRRLSQC